jgi:Zn-dependent protease with chaperone function
MKFGRRLTQEDRAALAVGEKVILQLLGYGPVIAEAVVVKRTPTRVTIGGTGVDLPNTVQVVFNVATGREVGVTSHSMSRGSWELASYDDLEVLNAARAEKRRAMTIGQIRRLVVTKGILEKLSHEELLDMAAKLGKLE